MPVVDRILNRLAGTAVIAAVLMVCGQIIRGLCGG